MKILKKILRKIMMTLLIIFSLLTLVTVLFIQQDSFGKHPSEKRLERILKSPNYRDGSFQNLLETPMMAEGVSYPKMLVEFLSGGVDQQPGTPLPSVKTELKTWSPDKPTIIWFGHSSYLIKIQQKNILVDPVFSQRTSPVQYMGTKSFDGASVYSISDLPDSIDVVIISHDHYDHLDHNSILQLKPKTKLFCTALGVGSHLSHWGIDEKKIIEFDWWESQSILPGFELTSAPARHFSGRGFVRNKTLWSAFILQVQNTRIFIGGDSGYDGTFKTVGEKYGPFDIALLECGQYDLKWPYIHMMPEEVAQASLDLQAKVLMPVHWGKFKLANHPWKEPMERVLKRANELNVSVTTPLIGEPVEIGGTYPASAWWDK
jgi:L-ascorbate metabolism protein UlaG (beta-lactamase superfamily)